MGGGLNQSGNSRLWIRQEVEHSLRRLQTDYIELYQLHCPDPQTSAEETLNSLFYPLPLFCSTPYPSK
ncbi:aldo/keto reductase [Paenibacillus sp. FSL L8-0436]|uniref:aldo/keto reductase n=1 Tax=Paenibacillus sp. FSL L8-0436 TaxID=2954686 RepID=UPI003157F2D4